MTAHRTAPDAITSAPEPEGWRLVDYRDARFAIPPGWDATRGDLGTTTCAPRPSMTGIVLYGLGASCPSITVEQFALGNALPPRAEVRRQPLSGATAPATGVAGVLLVPLGSGGVVS